MELSIKNNKDLVKNNFPESLFSVVKPFVLTLRQAQGERKNFNRSLSGSY